MGNIRNFEFEKLVMGIMYTSEDIYYETMQILENEYGKVDSVSDEYIFSEFSSFYDEEMDGIVRKRFLSFNKLVDPLFLSEIKLKTNDIENMLRNNKKRKVNIDPCLLSHGKFVMATTKNASFRIPHVKGIYAELSLVFARNHWVEFYWTYCDIKSNLVKEYLEFVRKIYLKQRAHFAASTI